MGIEVCVGGGARVEVPGARLGIGRERFGEGEGAGEGRREELFLAGGARVGMRRACVAGSGGGAMAAGEGPTVDEDTGTRGRGGAGGGGIRSDAVGGLIAGGGGGGGEGPVPVEEVVAGCEAEAEAGGRGSDSEKLGTEWAAGSVVLALALGVA